MSLLDICNDWLLLNYRTLFYGTEVVKIHGSEPVFLNLYGAQDRYHGIESASLLYVAWRAGTITLFLLGS
jgi:hypothetical protein